MVDYECCSLIIGILLVGITGIIFCLMLQTLDSVTIRAFQNHFDREPMYPPRETPNSVQWTRPDGIICVLKLPKQVESWPFLIIEDEK